MRVDVTQADLEGGIVSDPAECPISLAVRRQTGVRTLTGRFGPKMEWAVYLPHNNTVAILPQVAVTFAKKFDKAGKQAKAPGPFNLTFVESKP